MFRNAPNANIRGDSSSFRELALVGPVSSTFSDPSLSDSLSPALSDTSNSGVAGAHQQGLPRPVPIQQPPFPQVHPLQVPLTPTTDKYGLFRSILLTVLLFLETITVCTRLTLDPTAPAPYVILVLISGQVYYLAVYRLQPSVARYAEYMLMLATMYVTFGLWGYGGGTYLALYLRKLAQLAL